MRQQLASGNAGRDPGRLLQVLAACRAALCAFPPMCQCACPTPCAFPQLTGTIPSFLGSLTKLEELKASQLPLCEPPHREAGAGALAHCPGSEQH